MKGEWFDDRSIDEQEICEVINKNREIVLGVSLLITTFTNSVEIVLEYEELKNLLKSMEEFLEE